MDISSEDEEGEINKDAQLEERVRKYHDKKEEVSEEATVEDLKKVVITRGDIVKYCDMPWFESYLKGWLSMATTYRRS